MSDTPEHEWAPIKDCEFIGSAHEIEYTGPWQRTDEGNVLKAPFKCRNCGATGFVEMIGGGGQTSL